MTRAALVMLAACGGAKVMPDSRTIDSSQTPQHLVAYVSGYGPDIQWFDVDPQSGALTARGKLAAAQPSPSFLAIDSGANALYAVSESNNRVGAYAIDRASGALHYIDDASAGGQGPAHVALDRTGKLVLVANYGDGSVAVLTVRADRGVVDPPSQVVMPGAHAHMIITDPSNRYAFVPCLGTDRVMQYKLAGTLVPNGELATAAGAGPRHMAWAPNGMHAYVIDELSSTVMALAFDAATGHLTALQTIATVPQGTTNTGAEIAVHPSGQFVFASNRGDDSIVTFAVAADATLTQVARTPTGGKTPRSFGLDPAGKFLYAANQDSNSVVPFAIHGDGTLSPIAAPIAATQPSFVGIVVLE